MTQSYAKDMFQLQAELLDTKVDMAAGKAIDRLIEKINDLKYEMHLEFREFRREIEDKFIALDQRITGLDKRITGIEMRLVAVETKLGMIGEKKKGIYDRMLDYLFKAGYALLNFISIYFAFLITQAHLVR